MKQFVLVILSLLLASCTSYDVDMEVFELTVRLSDIDEVDADMSVQLRDQYGQIFTSSVDGRGEASFSVTAGLYQASMSCVVEDNYFKIVYNASNNDIVVGSSTSLIVDMKVTTTMMQTANPVLIKEIYCGGCQKDDGSGKFVYDKCIVLYNNSFQPVRLSNMAIGIVEPYNAESNSHYFFVGDQLVYSTEDWIPAINGIWYFNSSSEIAPYSELVIAVCGAIDNTLSYSQSINYAKPEYYCMYDPEASSPDGVHYNNTTYYPSPSVVIPTSHYLKAVKYGKSNAWPMSQTSPAVILFSTVDISPKDYAEDESNLVYPSNRQGDRVYACLRVPREWVIDGVEVFNTNKMESCKKRMTPDVDNGYISLMGGYGHSLIRNVDNQASAISGHIIYQDTNNSSNDFYEADMCSLR